MQVQINFADDAAERSASGRVLAGTGLKCLRVVAGILVLALLALPARAADDRAVISRVAPSYPEIAKRMRISGMVKLEVTVSPEGKVTAVKVVSGNGMLGIAAMDAVKKWKFAPAAAESTVEVELNFAMAE